MAAIRRVCLFVVAARHDLELAVEVNAAVHTILCQSPARTFRSLPPASCQASPPPAMFKFALELFLLWPLRRRCRPRHPSIWPPLLGWPSLPSSGALCLPLFNLLILSLFLFSLCSSLLNSRRSSALALLICAPGGLCNVHRCGSGASDGECPHPGRSNCRIFFCIG